MKSITVVADDRVGLLADISYILGKARINIESVSVDSIGGKAIIVLTVRDTQKTADVLQKSGYSISEANVLVVKLSDQPGELSKITAMLVDEKVNIQNVHMLSRDGKQTVLALMLDKPKKAEKLLAPYLITSEE
ncbi:MAG: ACT domain-containing protein [Candidatus Micrarchaeota archaeon]